MRELILNAWDDTLFRFSHRKPGLIFEEVEQVKTDLTDAIEALLKIRPADCLCPCPLDAASTLDMLI